LLVTLVFGWLIEAYAAEVNARGAAKVQQALQMVKPDLEVDRFIGDRTVAAAEDIATAALTEAPTTKKRAGKTSAYG
jgi:lysozyme family protein